MINETCWCWTSEQNRLGVIVRKEEVIHYQPCRKMPQALSCGCVAHGDSFDAAEASKHQAACPYQEATS